MKRSVGIIGCGDIGFLFDHKVKREGALTHFKAFRDSGKFEVVAVAERKKSIRNMITGDYKVRAYSDYRKLLKEEKCDVIVIATNDESHFEILKAALDHSPKLVFCEKPLAMSLDEVKRIVKLYDKKRTGLQVNFTRRFLSEFFSIREDIKRMKIESMTFYYQRGLIHNASHYLDLIGMYIGETEKKLEKISVREGISKKDDTVSFDMKFRNGIEIRFIGLSNTKLSFGEVDMIGSKGRIRFNHKNEIEKYGVTGNKVYKGYQVYELSSCRKISYHEALPNAVDNIYKYLTGKEKLKSPASNSIKIFELINRVKEKRACLN